VILLKYTFPKWKEYKLRTLLFYSCKTVFLVQLLIRSISQLSSLCNKTQPLSSHNWRYVDTYGILSFKHQLLSYRGAIIKSTFINLRKYRKNGTTNVAEIYFLTCFLLNSAFVFNTTIIGSLTYVYYASASPGMRRQKI
jgi:hypothetical protein